VTGPAGAGALLIGSIVTGALTGLAVGALIGAPAVLAFVGGAVGAVGGFWLVYQRFKDI
jgi:hypothetical protein